MKKPTFFGSSKMGERGQVVVPQSARKSLRLKPGNGLIFLGFEDKHLMVVKESTLNEWLDKMSAHLKEMRKAAKK